MTQTMNQPMKTLTRIRLINWHYFSDVTINVKGSVLFSGENASGKSTILDAIQLVLTTNSRRFNPAANERSKRTLQGYVRCKTGEEGNTYLRSKGAVISYVALEFYEESRNRYFVIGVKMDSAELDSEINKKWFCVEGDMDTIAFTVDGRPALDKEFTQNGKKVPLETQVGHAKEMFKARMGRLDEKFCDMITKSMAFKPMDKVKDFIYSFILPESNIETAALQGNIRNLREMQKLINDVKLQIEQLRKITAKADEIDDCDYRLLVVDILMKIAVIEDYKSKLAAASKRLENDESALARLQQERLSIIDRCNSTQERLSELTVAVSTNECGRLIEKIENEIRALQFEIDRMELDVKEYSEQFAKLELAARKAEIPSLPLLPGLKRNNDGTDRALEDLQAICAELGIAREDAFLEKSRLSIEIEEMISKATSLENRIGQLKKNRLVYDENTTRLLSEINKEFASRGIDCEARIFADLLEITMPEWRDAVEGYLNTQRFNIIVEPRYYDIAADVYDRLKARIHSAGLVNTEKLMQQEYAAEDNSLADVVSSENQYARAYATYLLGRVIRCDSVKDLKEHRIAITRQCMKYQNYVLQKIPDAVYRTPFIGSGALKVQLANAQKEYDAIIKGKASKQTLLDEKQAIIDAISHCNFDTVLKTSGSLVSLTSLRGQLKKEQAELASAQNNPTFIELSIKLEAAKKANSSALEERDRVNKEIAGKERDKLDDIASVADIKQRLDLAEHDKESVCHGNLLAMADAEAKYEEGVRTKTAETILENYARRRKAIESTRSDALVKMAALQATYKDGDFGTGLEVVQAYRDDLLKLEKSDLITYEERLAKAQEDCEIEFRENFLAKMRENISRAEIIFSQLNKSLKGIYYGNDSYKFELSANKERQSLYDMIMSDINVAGQNLFTSMFEEQYHAEMEELFSKLTDENLVESSVVNELTDYRSYLDYDIKVISRDGRVQLFSKTYGEKSGGETQTPYYVAIAASFAQLYSDRETVRLILLDEAFNNMDEDRIKSMMQFFNSQNFQVVLAAPPARMETIGEYVDSIFLAIRGENCSMVEEYYL